MKKTANYLGYTKILRYHLEFSHRMELDKSALEEVIQIGSERGLLPTLKVSQK